MTFCARAFAFAGKKPGPVPDCPVSVISSTVHLVPGLAGPTGLLRARVTRMNYEEAAICSKRHSISWRVRSC
jgi:hypothetical protein